MVRGFKMEMSEAQTVVDVYSNIAAWFLGRSKSFELLESYYIFNYNVIWKNKQERKKDFSN